ncbi:MAG: hypothetical protein U0235_18890, partial [Polyangiaceae bacterium]
MLRTWFLPCASIVALLAMGCGSSARSDAEESSALSEGASADGVEEQALKTPISLDSFEDDL